MSRKNAFASAHYARKTQRKRLKQKKQTKQDKKKQVANDTMNTGSMQIWEQKSSRYQVVPPFDKAKYSQPLDILKGKNHKRKKTYAERGEEKKSV